MQQRIEQRSAADIALSTPDLEHHCHRYCSPHDCLSNTERFRFKMLRDASVIIGPGRGGAPIVTTTTPPAASSTASTLTATRNTRRGGSVLHSSVGTAGSGGSDRDVEDEEKEEKDGAYLHDASWWLNHVHDSCGSSSQSKKKRQKLAGAPKLSTSTRTSSEGPRGPAGGARGKDHIRSMRRIRCTLLFTPYFSSSES